MRDKEYPALADCRNRLMTIWLLNSCIKDSLDARGYISGYHRQRELSKLRPL
jgi:hypothetical protein